MIKHKEIEEWIESGGALWIEPSAIYPHEEYLYTTDDNGEIIDIYNMRDPEYKDMDIDTYLKFLARKALDRFNYTEEEIEDIMAGW